MADEPIPETLLDLQRRFETAQAHVETVSASHPGPISEWTDGQRADLNDARDAARAAAVALHRAKTGTPFYAADQAERLRKAARGE